MLLLFVMVQFAYASSTLQSECDIATGFVSSLQKQHAEDVVRLTRLRNKVTNLGIQRFPGAVHTVRDFTIKLPLGSTLIPFASNSFGLRFDGLSATNTTVGASFYDVDYGAAIVAVIPDSKDAVQWERFLTSTVRSPNDILFREPDGVIYYDHKSNALVAVYHQYDAISGFHTVGRAVISGGSCAVEASRSNSATINSEVPLNMDCCNKDAQPCSVALRDAAIVGSGLSAEADMPRNSASMIATASLVSANAHSRCSHKQPRTGGIKEIIRLYSQLRTLNPQNRDTADTYAKAYSIKNFGVKNAYIVWNDKKEGGVLLADGTVIVPPKYCSLYVDTFGYVVTDDHGVGILDFSGKTVLPCKYTLFSLSDNGLLKVGKQKAPERKMRYGLYDLQKRIWVEPIKM
jgi:hypothetical protein